MKITIEINEIIAKDFKTDKFEDFFGRVISDIDYNGLCGLYEKETAEELKRAFKEAEANNK